MSTSRRVTNEISRGWTEAFQENSSIYHLDLQPHSATFYMFLPGNYEPILITLNFFHRSYPFKPPKVYIGINKKEYISLLPTSWSFQEKILGKKCLCFSSILCKWVPQRTIMDIMNEIKETFILKMRMMEIAHCRKIVEKKIGINYVPIEEFI